MNKDVDRFLIDDSRSLQAGQKYTAIGITFLFWMAYLYLWQPLVSLIAWGLGWKLFYNNMIVLGGYEVLLGVVKFYLIVITILGGGLIVWGRVNQWRFRGKGSREFSNEVDVDKLHEEFSINESQLTQIQSSSSVKVKLKSDGSISNIVS